MTSVTRLTAILAALALLAPGALAEEESKKEKKPDFPPHAEVTEGYRQVVSTVDGKKSLYTIWIRDKDQQMLAELPSGYASQKHFIAMTVPTGELFAGLQMREIYCSWKRYDKRLALIEPNVEVKSSGDQSSKDSIENHFVDRVVLDVPIVCMGPGGQPMIDMDELLLGDMRTFYGSAAGGANPRLATIKKAKAFPENVELAFELPVSGGELKTFHYSISKIGGSSTYKTRAADERIGYFTTVHRDLGIFRADKIWKRNINRWHLEKADSSLKVSPPKNPITFYIEHTVPVRYRRWVKHGIEYWNRAFEEIGISDAVVVHYQDKSTGANMEKDPEDVRYNFIRWLSNDIGTAIGPSRAHPETGQILDADVVLTDGWIRAFWYYSNEYLPKAAMEGTTHETLRFYEEHPNWDPRVRLAPLSQRGRIMTEITRRRAMNRAAGVPEVAFGETASEHDSALDRLAELVGRDTTLCMAADAKAAEMSVAGLTYSLFDKDDDDDDGEDEEGEEKKEEEQKIDGIPESFLGPMLADLVAHEVGHTLGLRHNFKASSLYTLKQINSEEFKSNKAFAGSVMDYIPVNFNMGEGEIQGDWAMIDLGPYDMWAIEYGYGFGKPEEVLKRSAEPELAYSTDYDTTGPDPLARRYDFAKDPLQYAQSRMKLILGQRSKILTDFVADGDSWGKARRGYGITLGTQVSMVNMMANWLGGAFLHNDHKGDPDARAPIVPASAHAQREALAFVIDNAMYDEAFGLTPELIQHMTIQKWSDGGGSSSLYEDSTYPIHDKVAGIQASVLSMLMNPSTLRRVYDNEQMIPSSEDTLTLPEMMQTVCNAVWSECEEGASGSYTAREPMISSLRRNLQQEHLERLIDLSMGSSYGAVEKPISDLARHELRNLRDLTAKVLESKGLDAYTSAHLAECGARAGKALEAGYTLNEGGSGGGSFFFFGEQPEQR